MPKVTATREVRYAGVTYTSGQSFEASEKDAKTLKAIKKVVDATGDAPVSSADLPKAAYQSKTEEAEETAAPLSGSYRRRDMRAVGQTGEEKLSPSLRRGRPPKQRT
jgi:hypothetical protein